MVSRDARRGIYAFEWSADGRDILYLQDRDGDENWHLFSLDLGDGQGGAIYPAQEGQSPGTPIVYFDTADIDASIAKVRELGGTADDKQPVPTHGWFAGCTDTEGNAFHLWQGDETAA